MKTFNCMRFVMLLTICTALAIFFTFVFGLLMTIFVEGYDGAGVGMLLFILILCVAIDILILDFAFPCPKCHKQLSSMPWDIMFRKGFFFPYRRIYNIIRGKEFECLHCGWNAKNEDETKNGHDADA